MGRFNNLIGGILIILLAAAIFWMLPNTKNTEDLNYTGLLDTIAKGESRGNYNAYFGNTKNHSTDFTKMKISEVLQWQKKYVKKGSKSSAVGKYQIIRPTLTKLVDNLGIDKNARFSKPMQDKLAVALLEKRGLKQYINGEIDRKQFANNLSKEWAALPKVIGKNPQKSYYEGDGINKVQISIDEIYHGINSIE